MSHPSKLLLAAVIAVLAVGGFVLYMFLWVKFTGDPVPEPTIPRGSQTLGSGQPLSYVVMGDSTSVAQGGVYQKGYAVATAAYLARTHQVTWVNVGVSGARAADIASSQLADALPHKPAVVLIAVGANDVTHLTKLSAVVADLRTTITALKQANAAVRIILTGSPDMGAVPRFPQPLRWYAGKRTARLNAALQPLVDNRQIFFAPIAERTGPVFRQHPELFAADKFHPTTEGYATWIPVLKDALHSAGYK